MLRAGKALWSTVPAGVMDPKNGAIPDVFTLATGKRCTLIQGGFLVRYPP